MKLKELLNEETLQQAVKRLLKPADTIADVMDREEQDRRATEGGPSRDAKTAATLLLGKTTDPAWVLRPGGGAASERMLRSVTHSRPHETTESDEHGKLRVMRMPGSALLLVVGEGPEAFVVTTEFHRDRLVET